MIIRFKKIIDYITRLEKQKKKIEISKSEKTNLERKYNKLDRFSNIIAHWKSRIERQLRRYQED